MRSTDTPPILRALAAALCLLAAGLAIAACGGSSSPESAGSGSAGSAEDSALKFSNCMREHGIKDFPNPETTAGGGHTLKFNGPGDGVGPKTMESAQEACAHFQEEGGEGPERTPQEKVEQEEAVDKFAKCMREHGIEVEVSTAGAGVGVKVGGGPGTGGPNPKSPAFQEAQESCQSLMPGPKGGPGSGGGAVTKTPSGG